MLVIDPDECIDCAVCIPECPIPTPFMPRKPALRPAAFLKINVDLTSAPGWKSILKAQKPFGNAEREWKNKTNKLSELVR